MLVFFFFLVHPNEGNPKEIVDHVNPMFTTILLGIPIKSTGKIPKIDEDPHTSLAPEYASLRVSAMAPTTLFCSLGIVSTMENFLTSLV